jgi:hypothetical protein
VRRLGRRLFVCLLADDRFLQVMSYTTNFFKTPPRAPFSLVRYALESVILTVNVCGSAPFPFSIVMLCSFGGAYVIRFLRDDMLSHPLISATALVFLYYILVGSYRLFIYRRYLDPLRAIPGPKVLFPTVLTQRDIGYAAYPRSFGIRTYIFSELT